jgi:hypothetical protein
MHCGGHVDDLNRSSDSPQKSCCIASCDTCGSARIMKDYFHQDLLPNDMTLIEWRLNIALNASMGRRTKYLLNALGTISQETNNDNKSIGRGARRNASLNQQARRSYHRHTTVCLLGKKTWRARGFSQVLSFSLQVKMPLRPSPTINASNLATQTFRS